VGGGCELHVDVSATTTAVLPTRRERKAHLVLGCCTSVEGLRCGQASCRLRVLGWPNGAVGL
jgi:hypothetical protein